METVSSWLCCTLEGRDPYPLQAVYDKHIKSDNSFDLSEVLSFLPDKELSSLASLVQMRLAPTLSYLKTEQYQNEFNMSDSHEACISAALEIAWLLVSRSEAGRVAIRPLVYDLYDTFLELPNESQERVAKICEVMWHSGDAERDRVVPCTMLYLLQRSFGDESIFPFQTRKGRKPGKVADIHRVYAMRKALETLVLTDVSPSSTTMRQRLMRCASSSAYLRSSEGRKFLAYLLTLKDVKESTFDTLTNHLAMVRKSSANLFGTVFLYAWRSKREEWLAERLMGLSEKAIHAGSEPFSTNLRTVLSTFHANKRVNGVDLLLNNIYGPVLFRNLMVANPLVRRNAAIVLSDAFPIHDPGAGMQDIEQTIEFQCGKLLDLLQDPCSIVRLAAIEGSCRVLGLFWELVSTTNAKRVVDLLTSRLAFDASSPRVRTTVFEGIKFLLENHLSHQILAIALPRLGSVIHDRVERVRLSFLDLLLALKKKRMRFLRYFDVVDIADLLLRLPNESAAVSAKLMELLRTSYFPLERKGKSSEEIAKSQTRACLSFISSNREAALHFYKHLYLHIAPGPLLEFAMRLSYIALKAPTPSLSDARTRNSSVTQNRSANFSPKIMFSTCEENIPPSNVSRKQVEDDEEDLSDCGDHAVDRESMLMTVSHVLVSISISLRKEANKELQTYLDNIFGGEALRPLLQQKGNSLSSRAACWRIASCLPVSRIEPLISLWQKQMDTVTEWPTQKTMKLEAQKDLVSALLLCGLKWSLLPSMSSLFASWCDVVVNGNRASSKGIKSSRHSQSRHERRTDGLHCAINLKHDISSRRKCLFSLWVCGDALLTCEDLHDDFVRVIISSRQDQDLEDDFPFFTHLRVACLGMLDFFFEIHCSSHQRIDVLPRPQFLLRVLATTWRGLLKLSTCGIGSQEVLLEVRQLTQWFCSENVWKNAFTVGNRFATALADVCLAHCADTIAVVDVAESDINRYKQILEYIRREMVQKSPCEADRLVAEALRLSFLLREKAYVNDPLGDPLLERCGALALRKISTGLLSVICDILVNIKTDFERSESRFRKTTSQEHFLRDILIEMNEKRDTEDFRQAFSKGLAAGFETEGMAKGNVFSVLICKILASLIMSKHNRTPELGFQLFESVIQCFRNLDGAVIAADLSIGNFTKAVVDLILAQYDHDDVGRPAAPSDSAKECFAKICSLLEREVPQPLKAIEPRESDLFVVSEAQKILGLLRNMGERDVSADKDQLDDKPISREDCAASAPGALVHLTED